MELRTNNRISFVGSVITAWHLIGLKSYLKKLKSETSNDRILEGYVFIERHPKNGYLIKKEMLNFGDDIKCHVLYTTGTNNILDELKEGIIFDDEVYVITPCFPAIILCKKIFDLSHMHVRAVVIDEGVGCYDTSIIRWAKSVYIDTNSLKASIYFMLRHIYQKMLKRVKGISVERFMLFSGKSNDLVPDSQVINYYEKQIKEKSNTPIFVPYEKYIILFTNPLEEEGNVDGADLKELYSKIVEVCNNAGYLVLFRLHPREIALNKYENFTLINDAADSSENLLNRLEPKPDFVVGAHSTSLVTASLFYNIPAITIGDFIMPIAKTEYCKDLIKKYKKNFKNVVIFPDNWFEFKNMIS